MIFPFHLKADCRHHAGSLTHDALLAGQPVAEGAVEGGGAGEGVVEAEQAHVRRHDLQRRTLHGGARGARARPRGCGHVGNTLVLELETKVKQRFAKISQSRRRSWLKSAI